MITASVMKGLNINSVRNKFDSVIEIIKNFNIFLILEPKLDASFPKNKFKINSYKCFRRDRSKYGGGLIFYFNEGIPFNVLANQTVLPNVEMMAIEFPQIKCKWLPLGVYNLQSKVIQNLLKKLLGFSVTVCLLMKIFFYWVIST